MEIRFTNGQAVYQMVYDTISDILSGKEMIPEVTSTERKVEKKYEKNHVKHRDTSLLVLFSVLILPNHKSNKTYRSYFF